MTLKKLICTGALVLAGANASAQSVTLPEARAEADALLSAVREQDRAPGMMAAVIQAGELIWSGAVGYADLETGVALSETTRMRIGSVSKPVTAVLALRLAEQGRLDLDGDLTDAIPELVEPEGGAITPRHLAYHTAGIRQYDFSNYLDANNVFYYPSLSDALQRYAGDDLVSQPGEAVHYTSLGYNILGIAAERATDQSYSDLLVEEIARPLGLEDTLIDHPLQLIERRTRFYTRFPDGSVLNTIWRDSSDYYPSGGLLSTARDLAVFTDAVFSGAWLSQYAMSPALEEGRTLNGEATGRSFGWEIVRDASGQIISYEHGGETNGANAYVRHFPDQQLTVVGIMNMNFAAGEPAFFEMVRTELPALFMEMGEIGD